MADAPLHTVPAPGDIIQFAGSHRVQLTAGDYELEARQVLRAGAALSEEAYTSRFSFTVAGDRYVLPPDQIRSVFPAAGSQGNFWHVLPHLVLERSTLPWERTGRNRGSDPATDPPWLALLVFHASDPPPQVRTDRWGDLRNNLGLNAEVAESAHDLVKTITLPLALAKSLLPANERELQELCHVRRRLIRRGDDFNSQSAAEDFVRAQLDTATRHALPADGLPAQYAAGWLWRSPDGGESYEVLRRQGRNQPFECYQVAHEAATILANRLPQPGARNTVHLVALEGRYGSRGLRDRSPEVTLISLHQWEFYCESEKHTFKGLLENLNKDEDGNDLFTAWRVPVPAGLDPSSPAGKAIRAGWAPLRHRFREGSRSVSWYHGPLVPKEPKTGQLAAVWGKGEDTLTVRQADELLLYDSEMGMYDVSYAAAWELGRLLTLENTRVALDLLHWKRQHAHELHAVRHLAEYGYHLPVTAKTYARDPDDQRAANIWRWLDELTLLHHIPFNYLIPHPDMLPNESIHFFTVDRRWIECLRDGAFSIGRVLERDGEHDDQLSATASFADELPYAGGFLLRSALVTGWPDMQITGYKKSEAPVDDRGILPDPADDDVIIPLRTDKLAPNVLLVLFPERVGSVDFYLKPETLHFGLDIPASGNIGSDEPEKLVKAVRDPDTGKETNREQALDPHQHFRDLGRRVLAIDQLAVDLLGGAVLHSGALALQLTAGTPLVRIIRPMH